MLDKTNSPEGSVNKSISDFYQYPDHISETASRCIGLISDKEYYWTRNILLILVADSITRLNNTEFHD